MADQSHKKHDKKNPLEWIVFTTGLLLVLGILGYLVYETITFQPSSPDLVLEHTSDPSPSAPYRYHVTIVNRGQQTAEEVNIELVLEKNGREWETASLLIPFAPQQSKREGWVNFSKDPVKADTLISRVVSYKKP